MSDTVKVTLRPAELVSWFSTQIQKAATEGPHASAARLAHVTSVAKAAQSFENTGADEQKTISIEMLSAFAPEPGKSENLTANADQKVSETAPTAAPTPNAATAMSANQPPAGASPQAPIGSVSLDMSTQSEGSASYLSKFATDLLKSLGDMPAGLAPSEAATLWPGDLNRPYQELVEVKIAPEALTWGPDPEGVR